MSHALMIFLHFLCRLAFFHLKVFIVWAGLDVNNIWKDTFANKLCSILSVAIGESAGYRSH